MDAGTGVAAPVSGLAADPRSLAALGRDARADTPEARRKVAVQFEALFMDQLVRRMRATAPGETPMDNAGTRMFRELLDQETARTMAEHGGIGLADMLVRQLGGAHAAVPLQKLPRQP